MTSTYEVIVTLLTLYYLIMHVPITMAVTKCRDCDKILKWYKDGLREVKVIMVFGVATLVTLTMLNSITTLLMVDITAFVITNTVFNLVVVRMRAKACIKHICVYEA